MELVLTGSEVNVVKIWAESSIHGGHWGDSDLIIPEEDIILNKINNMNDYRINISKNEARIILTWSETSFGIHTTEEESVINKLKKVCKKVNDDYSQ